MDESARLEREAEFHDHAYTSGVRRASSRFYKIAESSKAEYRRAVLAGCTGLQVLEYGCGPGSCAFDLARSGASVTGIDISPAAIELASERAEREDLENGEIRFRVMNAEQLEFENGAFDRVCGSGILHHLEMSAAMAEISRVLRPQGTGVFYEPLGHNPLINLYRRLTPSMRTDDEQPLIMADLRRLGDAFGQVRLSHHHLTALAAVALWRTPFYRPLRAVLDRCDRALLQLPFLRAQAWVVIVEVAEPRAP
ncbi:MAG: class I SAM-dependent methyltransferase [Candidatus Latescibacterota bacterium]|nr:class I SAM-dependent methyltransferase [Candidatus Latescibacterota bacterium]